MKPWPLLFILCHLCFSGDHVFYVRDLHGRAIPKLAVGTKGGTPTLSDASGKLILTLDKEPGSLVQLLISDAKYRWVTPHDGQLALAAAGAASQDLVVAKKGGKDLIKTRAGIEALIRMTLAKTHPQSLGEQLDVATALKQVAVSWALPLADLKKGIRDYKATDVYQQGLMKLMENKHSEAELLLEEAVA